MSDFTRRLLADKNLGPVGDARVGVALAAARPRDGAGDAARFTPLDRGGQA